LSLDDSAGHYQRSAELLFNKNGATKQQLDGTIRRGAEHGEFLGFCFNFNSNATLPPTVAGSGLIAAARVP
jgi:hypothetical protein